MDSNKFLKKISKKLRKHQHTISKETGVVCSETPTPILGICNAGQINGLTEDIIVEHFCPFGALQRLLLIPGKSCSFIQFKNLSSAISAYESTNAKLNIAQDNKPIFLTYVEELPETVFDKIYNQLPPGLTIIENFVDEAEEAELLSLCTFDNATSSMKHRQVKHFGYKFRYDINNVDKDKPMSTPIPSQCNFLWSRLPFCFEPDQLTINHYTPGQGIPAHIDTHSAFEDPILSLSLGADIIMDFKKTQTFCVLLPRRSLAVISGESRYDWSHGIVPRKYDFHYSEKGCNAFKRETRISFTFRKVRKGECDCNYKINCDSHARSKIEDNIADILENQHVHNVYEDIAQHFSDTRHKPWPNVLEFVQKLKKGSVLVDVGCGNGKYFGQNQQIVEVGTDRSFKLNEVCKDRGFEVFNGNCLSLPLRDNIADAAISIAVIHHLSTQERRLKALTEIARILKVGGEALVYVWAKEQVKNKEKSTYIKQDRKNRKSEDVVSITTNEVSVAQGITLPVHNNRADFSHSDVLVPWKLKGQSENATFLRFYHVFEQGELEQLCQLIDSVTVIRSYYDQGNYCVLFRKIKTI